jgi:hypothetical protein
MTPPPAALAVDAPPRAPPIRQPGKRAIPTAPIRVDEAYSLAEFLRRVGWRRGALSTARREGLRVVTAGGLSYVLGSDWIRFLDQRGQRQQ